MRKVYHGSDHILKSPVFGGGKADNDYGNGFYTTEYEDRARSWAALNGKPDCCIVNEYELDEEGLKILDLNEHGVLAWIAEVMANRGMNQEAANMVGERMLDGYQVTGITEQYAIRNRLIYHLEEDYYEAAGI